MIVKALAREVRALDTNLAPGEVITMREQVDRMSWSQRAAAILLTIFGALALDGFILGARSDDYFQNEF
jgi:hypothetical protein